MSMSRNEEMNNLLNQKIGGDGSPTYREFLGVLVDNGYFLDQIFKDIQTYIDLAKLHDQGMSQALNGIDIGKFQAHIKSVETKFNEMQAQADKKNEQMQQFQQEFAAQYLVAPVIPKQSSDSTKKAKNPKKAVSEPYNVFNVKDNKIPRHANSDPVKKQRSDDLELKGLKKKIIDEINSQWNGNPPENRSGLFGSSLLKQEIKKFFKDDANIYYDSIVEEAFPEPKIKAQAASQPEPQPQPEVKAADPPKDKEEDVPAPKQAALGKSISDPVTQEEKDSAQNEVRSKIETLILESFHNNDYTKLLNTEFVPSDITAMTSMRDDLVKKIVHSTKDTKRIFDLTSALMSVYIKAQPDLDILRQPSLPGNLYMHLVNACKYQPPKPNPDFGVLNKHVLENVKGMNFASNFTDEQQKVAASGLVMFAVNMLATQNPKLKAAVVLNMGKENAKVAGAIGKGSYSSIGDPKLIAKCEAIHSSIMNDIENPKVAPARSRVGQWFDKLKVKKDIDKAITMIGKAGREKDESKKIQLFVQANSLLQHAENKLQEYKQGKHCNQEVAKKMEGDIKDYKQTIKDLTPIASVTQGRAYEETNPNQGVMPDLDKKPSPRR